MSKFQHFSILNSTSPERKSDKDCLWFASNNFLITSEGDFAAYLVEKRRPSDGVQQGMGCGPSEYAHYAFCFQFSDFVSARS